MEILEFVSLFSKRFERLCTFVASVLNQGRVQWLICEGKWSFSTSSCPESDDTTIGRKETYKLSLGVKRLYGINIIFLIAAEEIFAPFLKTKKITCVDCKKHDENDVDYIISYYSYSQLPVSSYKLENIDILSLSDHNQASPFFRRCFANSQAHVLKQSHSVIWIQRRSRFESC